MSMQLQQKALELQLADLKLQQQEEKSAKEQTQIQLYAEQVSQLLTTEKNLRLQLAADEQRFQQFQVFVSVYIALSVKQFLDVIQINFQLL